MTRLDSLWRNFCESWPNFLAWQTVETHIASCTPQCQKIHMQQFWKQNMHIFPVEKYLAKHKVASIETCNNLWRHFLRLLSTQDLPDYSIRQLHLDAQCGHFPCSVMAKLTNFLYQIFFFCRSHAFCCEWDGTIDWAGEEWRRRRATGVLGRSSMQNVLFGMG